MGIQRQMETKALAFEGIGFDAVEGTVEGIAAVYGNWDRANECIEDGACAKSIAERGHKIPMGLDHMHGFGVSTSLQELTRQELPARLRSEYPDATGGLGCKGQAVLSDENIRRLGIIKQRTEAGNPPGMSITYRVLREAEGQTPTGAKGRRLLELALHEWGPQLSLRPVNPAAMVTEAKATGNGAGAKGWDNTIPGSDEERHARLTNDLRKSMMLGGMDFSVAAVLPDALIVEVYNETGPSRTYRAPYTTGGSGAEGYTFGPMTEVDIRPTIVEKAESIGALQSIVDEAAAQMKAGAVLSAANLNLVEAAIEALTALRAAARKESAGDTGAKGDEPAAPAAPAAPDAAMPRTDWGLRLRLAESIAAHASQRLALLPRAI